MHQQVKERLHNYVPHDLNFMQESFFIDKKPVKIKMQPIDYCNLIKGTFPLKQFPLMRPLSSLTKPITVEGYNDGKPFVPESVIMRMLGLSIRLHVDQREGDIEVYGTDEFMDHYSASFKIYELLFRWHFWLWDQQLFKTGDIIEIKD